MRITQITAADLPLISELARHIWPVAYAQILSPAQLEYMLEQFYSLPALTAQFAGGQQFLVLWEEEQAIGFAAFGPLEEAGLWKLHKLYVLPQKHRTGGGRALLKEVEMRAGNAGAQALTLNVNRHNQAVGFYRRQGYEIVLEEDIAIGGGYFMNDYRMRKKLC